MQPSIIPRPAGRARRTTTTFVLLPLLALLALAGWAFSSPVGSSPDEDFHLASVWCAAGERTSLCESTGDPATRMVAPVFAEDPCFAQRPAESAACQLDLLDESVLDTSALVESARGNFVGTYPPVFYGTMSLLATDDVQSSVLAMRMLNATLFVALVSALVVLLPAAHRVAAVGSFLITLVPLGLFLIPSLNPSAWAIIGVGVSWLALLGFVDVPGRRRWALGALFAIGALMAGGARADAGVYVLIGIAAVLVLRFAPTRAFALTSILPALVGLIVVLGVLDAGQLASAVTGFGGAGSPNPQVAPAPGGPNATPAPTGEAPGAASGAGLALTNLVNMPLLWAGVFGFWGLGWLDTSLPAVVGFGGVAVFVAVAFTALAHVDLRRALVLAGLIAALWFIPTWTLTRGGDQVGTEVQPRYLLPLIVMLAGFALLESRGRGLRLGLAQLWIVGLTLVGTNALSLYVNLRRYVTGDDVKAVNLDAGVEWWWAGMASPMTTWVVASAAWAALVCLVLMTARSPWRLRLGDADDAVGHVGPAARV